MTQSPLFLDALSTDPAKTLHLPLPVAGYSVQSAERVDLVNQNKALEERVLRQLDLLLAMDGLDKRNLALAKTHIEDAFMRMNRAVFQPGRISLPEDGQ